MDSLALVIVLVLFTLAWLHAVSRRRWRRKLPPGPYPFPIIGNILQLSENPHQSFAKLSKSYGPLMSLQLGRICTIVASSPEMAEQVLREHDEALSNRHVISATEAHDFHRNSIVFLPVGGRWKKARKLCREHLFSSKRLDESQGLRLEKLTELHEYLHQCSLAARVVNIGEAVFITALNLMNFTFFSTNFATFDSDVTQDLKKTVEGLASNLGAPNLADFFPFQKPFDPQGMKKRSEFYIAKLLGKFEDIINRRLQSRMSPEDLSKKYDLLETLVNLMEESDYSLSINDIKYLFLDLFLAQTHTITSAVEWAMTELLINPAKMAIARNELTSVIGEHKHVAESDISRLPYLQAVIKETLRLHPAAPLLIPRKTDKEVEINGYTIPKSAQILVNIWCIGRDSSIWPNPTSFEPERFLNIKIDYKGQDFRFTPFGSGRRICPGILLADRMLPLMVASLIHKFDWKLEAEDVDTTDMFGIAMRKAVPLMAVPIEVV